MANVPNILRNHGQAYAERIARLEAVSERVLPRLGDTAWCNTQFEACGRSDLELRDPITLPQLDTVPNPADHNHVGNFASDFRINMGMRPVIVHGPFGDHTEEEPVPVSTEYLLGVRDGSIAADDSHSDHLAKPAFHRALCIEPGVVIDTTVRISKREPLAQLGPEVLLVHSIMSRLVDRGDRSAVRSDGTVNTGYLCANHSTRG